MQEQPDPILQQDPDNQFLANKQPHANINHLQQESPNLAINNKKPSKIKTKKAESKKLEKGVEDNPQYFRVDFEVTHKLYEVYRRLKLFGSDQAQSSSFQQKQEGNNTINYHKIMEMFKDINFKLQINQKLQVLRAIKKFCFNPNFINQEEFIKIFKVIVHGIGIKQIAFKSIIANKYASIVEKQTKTSNYRRAISIKLNKNFGQKVKTEQMQGSKIKYSPAFIHKQQKSFQTVINAEHSYLKKLPTANPSVIIEQAANGSMQQSGVNTTRKLEGRRKMLTQASRYDAEKGYLNRAIQKNKLGKLTWQNLFKMTEDNMHYNITIPSFVTQDITLNDLEL